MSNSSPKSVHRVIIPLFVLVWVSMIGLAVFSLTSLFNPGKIEQTEDNSSQSNLPVETDLALPEINEKSEQKNFSVFALMIMLLACSGGSLLVTFVLKYLVTDSPKTRKIKHKKKVDQVALFSPRKSDQKLLKKDVSSDAVVEEEQVVVTVIAPQESTPVERRSPTLAETLDLRKRHSLMSIIQDN